VFVGYRYYEKRKVEPLFPFGHGLSYTTFEYASLRAPDEVLAGQPIHVSVEVTNTGAMPGCETVQLYVGDEVTQDVVRPVKELKGFHKVELAPGESQIVRFTRTTMCTAPHGSRRPAATACTWAAPPRTSARRARSAGSRRSTTALRSRNRHSRTICEEKRMTLAKAQRRKDAFGNSDSDFRIRNSHLCAFASLRESFPSSE
jgi:hypothetical protein